MSTGAGTVQYFTGLLERACAKIVQLDCSAPAYTDPETGAEPVVSVSMIGRGDRQTKCKFCTNPDFAFHLNTTPMSFCDRFYD